MDDTIIGAWPGNDYRYYLEHSAKGKAWKNHKYIAIKNGRYIYPKDKVAGSRRYGRGNIDLENLPMLKEKDGSYETLDTFSVGFDGKEVLLNCIQMGPDGKAVRVSEDEAINKYMKDGKHLGKFDSADAAAEYAKKLDKDQERIRANRLKNSSSSGSSPRVIYAPKKGKYVRGSSSSKKVKNALSVKI